MVVSCVTMRPHWMSFFGDGLRWTMHGPGDTILPGFCRSKSNKRLIQTEPESINASWQPAVRSALIAGKDFPHHFRSHSAVRLFTVLSDHTSYRHRPLSRGAVVQKCTNQRVELSDGWVLFASCWAGCWCHCKYWKDWLPRSDWRRHGIKLHIHPSQQPAPAQQRRGGE